jgi:hypothetical protein
MGDQGKEGIRGRKGAALGALAGVALAAAGGTAWAGPTIPINDQSYLTISYALQMWGQSRGYTSATNSASTGDFFLRRNRLIFNGQASDYVGFFVQLEAGNDGYNGNVDKNTFYRDAYVTVDYTDPIRFIAGRFKNTFTRENLEGCYDPLTLDRAEWLAYSPWGGTRDTGVAMWGNLNDGKFQYRLMVANGRDDTNIPKKQPRVTARMHWSFFDPEADYGYLGTYLGTKKVLTIGIAGDYQKSVAYSDFVTRSNAQNYHAETADFFYEQPFASGTYTLSGAAMRYHTGDAINAVSVDPQLPQTSELGGGYIKGAYLLPDKVGIGRLQFFGRHERSQYHLATGYGDRKWSGLGANYYVDGQKLKLTGEVARVKFDKQNPNDPSQRDYNQATFALQFEF